MFDVGFTELVLVGVIGLVILGPERLPVAARTVGKWVGKFKRMVSGVQKEINEELRVDEIRRRAEANKVSVKSRIDELQAEASAMEAVPEHDDLASASESIQKQPLTGPNLKTKETASS